MPELHLRGFILTFYILNVNGYYSSSLCMITQFRSDKMRVSHTHTHNIHIFIHHRTYSLFVYVVYSGVKEKEKEERRINDI